MKRLETSGHILTETVNFNIVALQAEGHLGSPEASAAALQPNAPSDDHDDPVPAPTGIHDEFSHASHQQLQEQLPVQTHIHTETGDTSQGRTSLIPPASHGQLPERLPARTCIQSEDNATALHSHMQDPASNYRPLPQQLPQQQQQLSARTQSEAEVDGEATASCTQVLKSPGAHAGIQVDAALNPDGGSLECMLPAVIPQKQPPCASEQPRQQPHAGCKQPHHLVSHGMDDRQGSAAVASHVQAATSSVPLPDQQVGSELAGRPSMGAHKVGAPSGLEGTKLKGPGRAKRRSSLGFKPPRSVSATPSMMSSPAGVASASHPGGHPNDGWHDQPSEGQGPSRLKLGGMHKQSHACEVIALGQEGSQLPSGQPPGRLHDKHVAAAGDVAGPTAATPDARGLILASQRVPPGHAVHEELGDLHADGDGGDTILDSQQAPAAAAEAAAAEAAVGATDHAVPVGAAETRKIAALVKTQHGCGSRVEPEMPVAAPVGGAQNPHCTGQAILPAEQQDRAVAAPKRESAGRRQSQPLAVPEVDDRQAVHERAADVPKRKSNGRKHSQPVSEVDDRQAVPSAEQQEGLAAGPKRKHSGRRQLKPDAAPEPDSSRQTRPSDVAQKSTSASPKMSDDKEAQPDGSEVQPSAGVASEMDGTQEDPAAEQQNRSEPGPKRRSSGRLSKSIAAAAPEIDDDQLLPCAEQQQRLEAGSKRKSVGRRSKSNAGAAPEIDGNQVLPSAEQQEALKAEPKRNSIGQNHRQPAAMPEIDDQQDEMDPPRKRRCSDPGLASQAPQHACGGSTTARRNPAKRRQASDPYLSAKNAPDATHASGPDPPDTNLSDPIHASDSGHPPADLSEIHQRAARADAGARGEGLPGSKQGDQGKGPGKRRRASHPPHGRRTQRDHASAHAIGQASDAMQQQPGPPSEDPFAPRSIDAPCVDEQTPAGGVCMSLHASGGDGPHEAQHEESSVQDDLDATCPGGPHSQKQARLSGGVLTELPTHQQMKQRPIGEGQVGGRSKRGQAEKGKKRSSRASLGQGPTSVGRQPKRPRSNPISRCNFPLRESNLKMKHQVHS